jgi:hypothetical protein
VADSETKVAQAVARCEGQLADGRDWLMGVYSIADIVTFSWLAGMATAPPRSLRRRAENDRVAGARRRGPPWPPRWRAPPYPNRSAPGRRGLKSIAGGKPTMRAIDYFDRGHDRDPQRLAVVDTKPA